MRIRCLRRRDEGYPRLLAEIPDPPARLWLRGDAGPDLLERPSVAIVGALGFRQIELSSRVLVIVLLAEIGIVVLLGVVIWRALAIASAADDIFGRLTAGGVACWFGFQSFQNIGMCLGIMPVTGVPLPLVSYGGSSMFAALLAVGLLQNIHLRTQRSMGLGFSDGHGARSRY